LHATDDPSQIVKKWPGPSPTLVTVVEYVCVVGLYVTCLQIYKTPIGFP